MDYQNEVEHILDCYPPRITICYKCNCRTGSYDLGHSRDHAHIKERKVCLAVKPKSRKSLFTFLHEVGHIVAYKADYTSGVPRALAEYNATEWAKREMRDNLHISVPLKVIRGYNNYISDKIARGLRRGLKTVPTQIRHLK